MWIPRRVLGNEVFPLTKENVNKYDEEQSGRVFEYFDTEGEMNLSYSLNSLKCHSTL